MSLLFTSVYKLCVSPVLLPCRMPLWNTLMDLICLRACSKTIPRQRHSTASQEWLLCLKHILCCLCFLIHGWVFLMTYNMEKSVLEILNPTLTFEHQMVELCVQLFEIGLAEHKQRETELSSFFSSQTAAVTDCQQKASQILAKFEQQHTEVSFMDRNVLNSPVPSCAQHAYGDISVFTPF